MNMQKVAKGNVKVSIKDEDGMSLTKNHGFTVREEDSKVLAFDTYNHEEYGNVLLFAEQIFFLKFWDTEDLIKVKEFINNTLDSELERRKCSEPPTS